MPMSHDFVQHYLAFMDALNAANHSLLWWALSVSSKTPFLSDFFQDLYCHSRGSGQSALWVRMTQRVKSLLQRYLPFAITRLLLQHLWLTLRFRRTLKQKMKENSYDVIIRSWLSEKSFSGDNYQDIYFNDVIDALQSTGKRVAVITYALKSDTILIRRALSASNIDVYPLECINRFSDIFRAYFLSLKYFFFPWPLKGDLIFDGKDVKSLLKKAIKKDFQSSRFFYHLFVYRATKTFFKMIRTERVIYPFENHNWEKMMLQAIQEVAPQVKTVGYQHAAVPRKQLNFVIGEQEKEIMPLPDVLLTTGEAVKTILEKHFHFPTERLRVGCALRQKNIQKPELETRFTPLDVKNVLIALPGKLQEDLAILNHLTPVILGHPDIYFVCKPHPLADQLPLKTHLKTLGVGDNVSFSADKVDSVLKTMDLVLYTTTTVCLEALLVGIPVCFVDLGEIVDPDPLFAYTGFKWMLKRPDDFQSCIDELKTFTTEAFQQRQQDARTYALSYLTPKRPELLKRFRED